LVRRRSDSPYARLLLWTCSASSLLRSDVHIVRDSGDRQCLSVRDLARITQGVGTLATDGFEARSRAGARQSVFLIGVACVVAGTLMHWPDFIMARDMHYHLSGMPMSPVMLTGMALIVIGLGLAAYGLVQPTMPGSGDLTIRVRTMDDRRLTWADVGLLAILCVGLVLDVMKPATISFVLPGMRAEYGLSTGVVALLPLSALTGTVVGSIGWGLMADRIGRRGSLLLAALMFIGTSICGAMPSFEYNLAMCFLMGASAGGMLPLVFALIAEIAPGRHRGLLSVLLGTVGSAGGYLAASTAAALLEPAFSWRVLWLIGLPTGVLLIVFSNLIPESPRFLVLTGRGDEARRTMRSYGAQLELVPEPAGRSLLHRGRSSIGELLRGPEAALTLGLIAFGLTWGIANFGFLTWLPTLLGKGTTDAAIWNGVLAKSALVALPGALLVAWMYGRWRARSSMVAFGALSALCLVLLGYVLSHGDGALAVGLLAVGLLVGLNGLSAMLLVYAAEVYPTAMRGTGTGLIAAATKLGGLIGPQLVAIVLLAGGGTQLVAWLVAVPLAVTSVLLWLRGVETKGRSLEDIQVALHG
jgi:MFS transporter, putative metabolite:H+ symporter